MGARFPRLKRKRFKVSRVYNTDLFPGSKKLLHPAHPMHLIWVAFSAFQCPGGYFFKKKITRVKNTGNLLHCKELVPASFETFKHLR